MKKQTRLVMIGVVGLIFGAAVSAFPTTTHESGSRLTAAIQENVSQTQSASGTISEVNKTNFVLTVQAIKGTRDQMIAQEDTPKSMTFQVDNNTTIEGKLAVGSNAEVTYRDDRSGNHVAIGVKVTPPKP
ncbi:MAG TPA: hypothetical protein VKR82_12490 [Candidatus Acidoferrales bacterium]|nr:hypothetical protein [Candidatus Acidoferrales bacterium]